MIFRVPSQKALFLTDWMKVMFGVIVEVVALSAAITISEETILTNATRDNARVLVVLATVGAVVTTIKRITAEDVAPSQQTWTSIGFSLNKKIATQCKY